MKAGTHALYEGISRDLPPRDSNEWQVMDGLCHWLDIRPSEAMAGVDFIRAHPSGPPNDAVAK